jgi:hypothetical protein
LNTAPLTSKKNECERADDNPVAGCAVFDSGAELSVAEWTVPQF